MSHKPVLLASKVWLTLMAIVACIRTSKSSRSSACLSPTMHRLPGNIGTKNLSSWSWCGRMQRENYSDNLTDSRHPFVDIQGSLSISTSDVTDQAHEAHYRSGSLLFSNCCYVSANDNDMNSIQQLQSYKDRCDDRLNNNELLLPISPPSMMISVLVSQDWSHRDTCKRLIALVCRVVMWLSCKTKRDYYHWITKSALPPPGAKSIELDPVVRGLSTEDAIRSLFSAAIQADRYCSRTSDIRERQSSDWIQPIGWWWAILCLFLSPTVHKLCKWPRNQSDHPIHAHVPA